MAWDVYGERLAVALGGSGPQAGSVALFATAADPMLSARLIGFIKDRSMGKSDDTAGSDRAGPSRPRPSDENGEIQPAEEEAQHADDHSRETAAEEKVALAFQPSFDGGSLLAIRRNDTIRVLPLYYRPA